MRRGTGREESVVFTLTVSVSKPSSLLPTLLAYVDTDTLTCNCHTHTTKAAGGGGLAANTKLNLQIEFFNRIKKWFPGAHVRPIEIDFGLF